MKMPLLMKINKNLLNKLYDSCNVIKEIDLFEFNKEDFEPWYRIPFLMNNIASDWELSDKLKLENLVQRFPDIESDVKSDQNEDSFYMSLREYHQQTLINSKSELYFKTQFHLNTDLRQYYRIPEAFFCWYSNFPAEGKRFALSWIYIGSQGTGTALHVDVWNTSAWNLVTSGKKLWLFYPPDQEEFLYAGKVNPFDPDLSLYPKFKYTHPQIAVQNPGDLIYTPSGWWHAVYNIEGGVSITENFINHTNIERVKEYFKQKDQLRSLASIEKIAKHFTTDRNYGKN